MATPTKPRPTIPIGEYQTRRERVLRDLKGHVGVVFAGAGDPPLSGHWKSDRFFAYLTGIDDEAGAAILFDPGAAVERDRVVLFLRPLNPEAEAWDGYRDTIGAPLRERTGFARVLRTSALPRFLTDAVRRSKKAACLHPFAVYEAPVSADLAALRKVGERVVGVSLADMTGLLPSMRAVKSAAELKLMRAAAEATAAGYKRAFETLAPGVPEAAVQRAIEGGFTDGGGEGPAYNSIVGSGINGTVLHYMANTGVCEAGDLLVIDAGASVAGYAADVTRTLPVSGTFTKDQRDVYEVVLRAQEAAIKAVRPGARLADADAAARSVIEKAGYGDAFIHGIGHHLGMEVHDATPDGPLKPGNVVTIEPGVYLPQRKLGVRIEDDILVTARGAANLTRMIPKTAAEVEAAMRGKRRR